MIKKSDLEQFTGTEAYHRYLCGIKITDGVLFLAKETECFWLLDIIASYQKKDSNIPFQIWELKVDKDKGSATVYMKENSAKETIVKQFIPFTDFPFSYIKLYLIDSILLLPSEY